MRDFGVELNTVEWLLLVCDSGERGVGRGGDCKEVWWETGEFVAVGHPDFEGGVEAAEEGIDVGWGGGVASYGEDGVAVFFAFAGGDMFAVVPGDFLEAVADAEDGDLRVLVG